MTQGSPCALACGPPAARHARAAFAASELACATKMGVPKTLVFRVPPKKLIL